MDVREYLKNYNQIGVEIRRLNLELNKLLKCREDTYDTLQAKVINDMPRNPHSEGDDVVSRTVMFAINRYNRSIASLTSEINELLDQHDLFNQIWFMDGLLTMEEKRIVDLRYFQELQWDDVAYKARYCIKQCRRIANEAIGKLEKEVDFTLQQKHVP